MLFLFWIEIDLDIFFAFLIELNSFKFSIKLLLSKYRLFLESFVIKFSVKKLSYNLYTLKYEQNDLHFLWLFFRFK